MVESARPAGRVPDVTVHVMGEPPVAESCAEYAEFSVASARADVVIFGASTGSGTGSGYSSGSYSSLSANLP